MAGSFRAAKTKAQRRRVIAQRQVERLRSRVYERDRWTCVYCGDHRSPLRVDHDVPVSKGGTSYLKNLVTACETCDMLKGNMTGRQFRRLLERTGVRLPPDQRPNA